MIRRENKPAYFVQFGVKILPSDRHTAQKYEYGPIQLRWYMCAISDKRRLKQIHRLRCSCDDLILLAFHCHDSFAFVH